MTIILLCLQNDTTCAYGTITTNYTRVKESIITHDLKQPLNFILATGNFSKSNI